MALALGFEDEIIFAVDGGIFLSILGVKVRCVFGDGVFFNPVDVVVKEADRLVTLVDDFNSSVLAERHVPEAVVGVGVLDDDGQADDLASFAETVSEEITDGCFYGRALVFVPVHAEEHLLMIRGAFLCPGVGFGGQKGNPYMCDDAGAFYIHQDLGVAGLDGLVVPVAVGVGFSFRVEFAIGPNLVGGCLPHTSAVMGTGEVCHEVGESGL